MFARAWEAERSKFLVAQCLDYREITGIPMWMSFIFALRTIATRAPCLAQWRILTHYRQAVDGDLDER